MTYWLSGYDNRVKKPFKLYLTLLTGIITQSKRIIGYVRTDRPSLILGNLCP